MEPPPTRPYGILRILCTFAVVATGAFAAWRVPKLSMFVEVFESMVEGGVQALPALPRLLLTGTETLLGWAAMVLVLALVVIWKSRKEASILITALAVSVFFVLLAIVPFFILQPVLQTVISKFEQ